MNALRGQAECTMRAAPNLLLGQKIWTKRPPTFSWIVLSLERLDTVSDFFQKSIAGQLQATEIQFI